MKLIQSKIIKTVSLISAVILLYFAAEACVFAETGEQGRFTVYYQDENGRELIEPHTFYDERGSKTVLVCEDIPGYEPVVKKLTKTISENDDENVFTFVYNKVEGKAPEGKATYDLDEKPPLAEPGQPMTESEELSFSIILLAVTFIAFIIALSILRHKKQKSSKDKRP